MVRAVIDSCILIDFLRGVPAATSELALYERPAISVISWMEVMAGTSEQTEQTVRGFLQSYSILEIEAEVAERAVLLRRSRRIKLPDAIIWATAQVRESLLVTRNTHDFDPSLPGVRVPYIL